MARPTTTNYAGRKYDHFIMGSAPGGSGDRRQATLVFSDDADLAAGIQAAVQSYVTILLTPRGTTPNADVGSDFMTLLRKTPPRSSADVLTYYQSIVGDVIRQVNLAATGDDERIVSAPITSSSLEVDSISITVSIVTAAGVGATFVVPIKGA